MAPQQFADALLPFYPLQRRRPSASGPCENTRIKTTRTVSILQLTMSYKRASNGIDFVEPTQYNVEPNCIAKNPSPEALAAT